MFRSYSDRVARRFAHYPLRVKLALAFLTIVMVSVAIVSYFNYRVIKAQLSTDVGENLQNLAASKAQAAGDLLAKQADTLEALSVNRVLQEEVERLSAKYPSNTEPTAMRAQFLALNEQWQTADNNHPLVQEIRTNPISIELLRFRNTFPDNIEVLVTDKFGAVVAATSTPANYYYAAEAWWQVAYREGRGGLYIGRPQLDHRVAIALPIYGRSRQVLVGILRTTFSLNVLLDILVLDQTGQNNRVDLYLPDSQLLMATPSGLSLASTNPASLAQLESLKTSGNSYAEIIYGDTLSLVSQAPINSFDPGSRLSIAALDWRIIAHQDREVALKAVNTSMQITLMTGLGALLLAGGLAYGVSELLARPIIRLTRVAEQIEAGDLAAQARVESGDEIGVLAETFNAMTAQLRQTLETLTQRTQMLETSAEVARAASMSLALDEVLHTSVELICERFNFYHASVFIIEPGSTVAMLHYATSKPGQALKAHGHQLVIGSKSLVGTATALRRPCVVQDVNDEPTHFKNPLLPDTQAEAVFPLLVGETVIGALDVQSTQANTFTPDIVALLTTLADQIAIAVHHARLYEEQRQTAEHLAEADRMKTQFLANMSHELRTPLNSIIGFSRVMLKGIDGPITDQQRADLNSIYTNGQHLLGLINNILDLSKIEAGKMELVIEKIDLHQSIKTVLATATGLLKDKPVIIEESVPELLPAIWADSTRIRQILLNLVSNAAKFTEVGFIHLTAQHDAQWVTINVADTGIGIPPEKLNAIFEEFTQVDGSTTRKVGGTGLGLSITKKLVQMHGGQIWVESEQGHGSIFTIKLPLEQSLVALPEQIEAKVCAL